MEIVAITLRIREELRRRLQRSAEKNATSLNAEMERRLEDSFDLTNTSSLIQVLVGGGVTAELLAAVARVLDLEGSWRRAYLEKTEEARASTVARYIALILIFTQFFSTDARQLDPSMAEEALAAMRLKASGGALNATELQGLELAYAVLQRVEEIRLTEPKAQSE
jgi:hypothetical protein